MRLVDRLRWLYANLETLDHTTMLGMLEAAIKDAEAAAEPAAAEPPAYIERTVDQLLLVRAIQECAEHERYDLQYTAEVVRLANDATLAYLRESERAAQPPRGVTPALAHPADSIDVERLAEALMVWFTPDLFGTQATPKMASEIIALEYARLSEPMTAAERNALIEKLAADG